MWILLFLCLPYICSVESNLAPSFITKCTWEDTKCLKESTMKAIPEFVKGIPEANVETLDPLKIKEVNATKPGLEIIVRDIVITGLKNCIAKEITRSVKKNHLFLQLECTVHAVGEYEMNGQIILLPVTGKGDLIADINQILISVNVDYETVEKAGKKYWKIKTWKYEYELNKINKSQVFFENLFPDNEVLRKTTISVIKDNGNEIMEDMGTPLITAVVEKIVKDIAQFFKSVPVEDLVIDRK